MLRPASELSRQVILHSPPNRERLILADRQAVWRAAVEAGAAQLREAIKRLYGGKSRINQVDRHVAEVLAGKAAALEKLAGEFPHDDTK